jgi:hypothetical protein
MSGVAKAIEASKKVNFTNLLKKISMFPAERLALGQLEQNVRLRR